MSLDISHQQRDEQMSGREKLKRLRDSQFPPEEKQKRLMQSQAAFRALGLDYGFDVETWKYLAQHPDLELY